MAEIAPDVNVLNKVLSQQVQLLAADAAMERTALQAHILVANRTIDEQQATIEAQQKHIEALKAKVKKKEAKANPLDKKPSSDV